jgi:hypothetical protein
LFPLPTNATSPLAARPREHVMGPSRPFRFRACWGSCWPHSGHLMSNYYAHFGIKFVSASAIAYLLCLALSPRGRGREKFGDLVWPSLLGKFSTKENGAGLTRPRFVQRMVLPLFGFNSRGRIRRGSGRVSGTRSCGGVCGRTQRLPFHTRPRRQTHSPLRRTRPPVHCT